MIFGPVGVIGVWAPAIANAKWHLNQEYVTLGRFITEAIVYTNINPLVDLEMIIHYMILIKTYITLKLFKLIELTFFYSYSTSV